MTDTPLSDGSEQMLREQITEAMKDAMRAREPETLSTVRMILAGIKDKDIAARPAGNAGGIGDPDILSLLQTMVKQRRESVALYAETDAAIVAAIAESGAASIKDMGKVMAALKAKYSGQMDFSTVGPAVKAKLGG